jgi:predicted PurR-regulated permease PerM
MNSFIKQNKIFIAFNTISVILFFVLLYLSIDFSSQSDELFKKAENTIKELSSINSDITELRHIESDYNEIQSDLKKLSSIEKDLSNFLSYL